MRKHVVRDLHSVPVAPAVARRQPDAGGLPEAPGFYAWWVTPGALPGVPRRPHPNADTKVDLLYVGIAPGSAMSRQTLRSRVLRNHFGGNTGSSTFRLSLAALLMDAEGYEPVATAKKCVLTAEDNRRLSEWQQANLALTWCEVPEPWTVEAAVIAEMSPPMNLAANGGHPFQATMSAARQGFRAAARNR